ncbi:MAG TPA: chorismate-binding protein, partial [Kineosporiaceae bacterium]|nr:chorismate-binding protein [Kineosporiaceae bacterium]
GVGGAFLNIRNALLDGGVLQARVGVGVIAESDAHDELLETRNKLSGLLEAVYRWDAPGSTPG